MAERYDQLDQLIDGLFSRAETPLPETGSEFGPLVRLAADLCALPDPQFKQRLKEDLQRRATPIPAGFRTVTPYLVVPRGDELIDFMKQALGAVETMRSGTPGGFHAEVRIGDSMLMVGSAPSRPPSLAALQHYVENPDEVYRRALQHGATSLQEPTEEHGERFACVRDPFGNRWYLGRSLGPVYRPQGLNDINLFLHPAGAARLIDFLGRAFSAETIERHDSPGGVVYHAKLRIGNSVVEMSESHGWWQTLPTMVFLYVPDADALYQQALAAGAISLSAPADLPYGRSAAVTDPVGHQWYMTTPPSR